MKTPELKQFKISKLRDHLSDRHFAVPKLQRNFVWDSERAAKLFDSIYYNMPIGSVFLWVMERKSANLIRQSAEVLPSFGMKHKDIWFIIDGQQRLSVIHQAFVAESRENDSGKNIDFSRLCFVVNPDKKQKNPPRIVYRKFIEGEFVKICDILSDAWKRKNKNKNKNFLRKIADCRKRLLNYPVPVVFVRSATLDEIGDVFIRVNSKGMRITSADRAIALMGELDVRAMACELRQKVKEKIFALESIDPILMGYNLISGTEKPTQDGDPPKLPKLEDMARRLSRDIKKDTSKKEEFSKRWHKYQKAFISAVEYLHHRFPVYNISYLPSANMLATLTVFFYNHAAKPNSHQVKEICKWFWATGVAQRYSGRGYHRNIIADVRFFESIAGGSKKRFIFTDFLDPVLDIQGAEYASRSALTRAFFCLLASNKPCYLDDGEQVPLGYNVISHANKNHRHHVFPQAQMKSHFPPRSYNSLCNICFLVASDNQKIGKRLPRNYLSEYRDARRQHFSKVMKSHLIPISNDSGVWKQGIVSGFKQFRQDRLKLICSAFEKVADLKLFRER